MINGFLSALASYRCLKNKQSIFYAHKRIAFQVSVWLPWVFVLGRMHPAKRWSFSWFPALLLSSSWRFVTASNVLSSFEVVSSTPVLNVYHPYPVSCIFYFILLSLFHVAESSYMFLLSFLSFWSFCVTNRLIRFESDLMCNLLYSIQSYNEFF